MTVQRTVGQIDKEMETLLQERSRLHADYAVFQRGFLERAERLNDKQTALSDEGSVI